ncbi:hypothetical protein X566_16615 [Afipia sp. P52-10]|uniref:nuclear transport factor 2 family protein n=1 Tax=Afipia sp. P52-10 TaxID=1429916 RepID=UPI0003DF0876|nr:nuclear transport factor 2 family protein [Afipia sp. P52-10]ETR76419.1 hypothetical protein X566_16615 [Afipia sp. P52-10]
MRGPTNNEREALLAAFAKALFAKDIEAIYRVVTPDFIWSLPIGPTAPFGRQLASREDLKAYFDERDQLYSAMRFHDTVLHHAPEVTLMTFRVRGTFRATDATFEALGMERYVFRDGRIALKDAYWKQVADERRLAGASKE